MSRNISQGDNVQASAHLLISFCNQLSSPGYSLLAIDANGMAHAQWVDFSSIPDEYRPSFSSICGICCVGEQVIIATQSGTPVLALLDIKTARVTNYLALNHCKDSHSLVYHNGYVHIVSTATNELYRVAFQDGLFGQEELYWRYPGVGYDKDEVHLNGLTIDEGRLIASCFGPRGLDGAFESEGRVFYVDSGQTIHGSLHQPHSPTVVGQRLIIAESAAHRIHIYTIAEQGEWKLVKRLDVGGYVRGVALQGNRLWVGISADRKLSRSRQKFFDAGEPSEQIIGDSGIVLVDLETEREIAKFSLLGFGREVYDIITLSAHPAMFPIAEVASTRIRAMESCVDNYVAELNHLSLESQDSITQLQRANADEIARLQLAYADETTRLQHAYADEIARLQQTLSWRITAPLRSFRKLWSRLSSDRK